MKVEILRMAEESFEHEIKQALQNGCFEEICLFVFVGTIEVSKERLLYRKSEMVRERATKEALFDHESRYGKMRQSKIEHREDLLIVVLIV